MIDKKIFATAMSILADRFNRPLHEATIRAYRDVLSRDLTTEEFVAAVDLAFRDCTFWPSPREIIEFVKPVPDLNLEAARAFDEVLGLGFPHPAGTCWSRETIETTVGEYAAKAFSAIGAQGRLRNISADDMPWARREFVTAYRGAALQGSKQITAARALVLVQTQTPALAAGSGQ